MIASVSIKLLINSRFGGFEFKILISIPLNEQPNLMYTFVSFCFVSLIFSFRWNASLNCIDKEAAFDNNMKTCIAISVGGARITLICFLSFLCFFSAIFFFPSEFHLIIKFRRFDFKTQPFHVLYHSYRRVYVYAEARFFSPPLLRTHTQTQRHRHLYIAFVYLEFSGIRTPVGIFNSVLATFLPHTI